MIMSLVATVQYRYQHRFNFGDTVDRLSGIGDTVDEMVSVTRRIPFWRVLSGGSSSPRKPEIKSDNRKDRKDKPE